VRRQPRGHVVKRPGMADIVTGPRDLRHHHPMIGTAHPGRVALQPGRNRPQVQGPPPTPTVALGIARAPPNAAAASQFGRPLPGRTDATMPPRPRRKRPTRPPCVRHRAAVAIASRSAPRLPLRFSRPQKPENLGSRRGAAADGPVSHPRMCQKSQGGSPWPSAATAQRVLKSDPRSRPLPQCRW
jgi:hypothetical protein